MSDEESKGWKPDEEFLRREREMVERRRNSPEGKRWTAEIAKAEKELEALDPASTKAANLRWWIQRQYMMFGMCVRPVD